ncbi:MAG: YfiR family protein [Steroidobacter sp.]
MTATVRADDAQQREDQFKAAYLFNFVKFVEWPSGAPADTLTVCFQGAKGVHEALANGIDSKRVGSRRLVAQLLERRASTVNCDVLYADAASVDVSRTAGHPVLTVSDAPHFAANGGMIELFTENHRLRFTINVARAHEAGLHISSDLLKLAADVQREEQ